MLCGLRQVDHMMVIMQRNILWTGIYPSEISTNDEQ